QGDLPIDDHGTLQHGLAAAFAAAATGRGELLGATDEEPEHVVGSDTTGGARQDRVRVAGIGDAAVRLDLGLVVLELPTHHEGVRRVARTTALDVLLHLRGSREADDVVPI